MRKKKCVAAACVCLALTLGGCKTPQDVTLFRSDSDVVALASQQPITARPGDKMQIVVKTKDAAVSALFNLSTYSSRSTEFAQSSGAVNMNGYVPSTAEGLALYTVDPSGDIDMPMLGKIHVEGMTRFEIAGFIKGDIIGRDLAKDPTVTVEFVGTGINLLGDVNHPGRYDMNRDRFTIIEALTLAGDIGLQGQRRNVKVLREEDGEIRVYTLDLSDLKGLVQSPAYFLRQNDVVYVEPNDMKKRMTTVNGNNVYNTAFWISVASLIATAVTTVGIFVNK